MKTHPSPMRVLYLLVGAALLSVGASPASAWGHGATVQTDSGPVTGIVTSEGRSFLGIPYAAPPVGGLRWRPPQPPASWTMPLDATEPPSNCPQGPSAFGEASLDEDCLYLNVYTPKPGLLGGALRRDPVMVWIHGGAFLVGGSRDYDPRELVKRNIVVVTINYRLGALGWLAHPALTAESGQGTSGNYGLLDQQAALEWVQRNISRFGGNPNNVTIFGQSAGGVSVHANMVSPRADGLFHRAIVQSGAYALTQPTVEEAEAQGVALADDVGCPEQDLTCLRSVPVAALLANQGTSPTAYMPRVDGSILPMSIAQAFASGQFNRVPVIEGSTRDEFRVFVALFFEHVTGPVTPEIYPIAIAAILGVPPSVVPAIIAEYPLSNYPSPGLALAAVGTDAIFACNALAATQLLSQHVPTWAYEFNDRDAPQIFVPPASFDYGAYHSSELQYLFDIPAVVPAPPLTAAQEQLSDTMIRYWTQHARLGNPNGLLTPLWVRFLPPLSQRIQSLEPPAPEPSTATDFAEDHHCEFWAGLAGAGSGN